MRATDDLRNAMDGCEFTYYPYLDDLDAKFAALVEACEAQASNAESLARAHERMGIPADGLHEIAAELRAALTLTKGDPK